MIYPRSFPNKNASYEEEKLFGLLSQLPPERYGVFYQISRIGGFTNKYFPAFDFLVVDKEQGILLLEVSKTKKSNYQGIIKNIDNYFRDLKKDADIDAPIYIQFAEWEYENWEYEDVVQLINKSFEEDSLTQISDENFEKLGHYFKKQSLYYTPSGKIKKISLSNFKGINQTVVNNLPKEANWIFLTGENGYGKTCVLQAIALGLYGPNEHFSPHEDIGLFGHALIDTEKQPNLEIDIQFDNLITAERYSYPTRKRNNFKTICAYGASRLSVFTERQSKHEQTPISSLFDNTTVLQNIEHHLYDWFLNKGNQVAQDKYNYTKQLLEELLEGIEIELSTTSKNIWYKETRAGQVYPPVTLNNLAAGYKSLVAMIGDLIIRLFETQPDAVNPAELTGIVIIDELDVHWHPKWQMQLPKLFSKLFPKIQFIVSTHSPIPLLGAPDHSVFLKVNRTSEEGITIARFEKLEKEIHQLTPNLLFSSEIFDFNFLDNLSEAQLDAVYLEDDYDEIERNKEIGEQLRAINEDILPDDLFPQPNS